MASQVHHWQNISLKVDDSRPTWPRFCRAERLRNLPLSTVTPSTLVISLLLPCLLFMDNAHPASYQRSFTAFSPPLLHYCLTDLLPPSEARSNCLHRLLFFVFFLCFCFCFILSCSSPSPFACVRVCNGPCSYRSRHLRGFHATISVTGWIHCIRRRRQRWHYQGVIYYGHGWGSHCSSRFPRF